MKNPTKTEKQLLAIAIEQGFKGDNLRNNPLLLRCMIAVWEMKDTERAKIESWWADWMADACGHRNDN